MVPTPVSGTLCGLSGALSVMVIAPFRWLIAVGVNVTVMVQNAPGVTGLGAIGQLLVCEKSPLLAMVLISRLALPELVSFTFNGLLLEPSNVLGKVRLLGARVTAGVPWLPQPGKLKLPMPVSQDAFEVTCRYSSWNQKVQSSAGSMVSEL